MTNQEIYLSTIQKAQEVITLMQSLLEAEPETWSPVTADKAATMTLGELVYAAEQKQALTGSPYQFASEFGSETEYMAYLVTYVTC